MRLAPSEIRARLEAQRQELLVRYKDELDRAEADITTGSTELVDIANDRWDARILAVMSEHDALALENIVAALHRLDHDEYGICTSCSAAISPARLEIVPEVARCVDCATREEAAEARSSRHAS